MKDFFCRLFTPWKAGSQFDTPEAFYSFLLGRDKLLGTIRNLCFAAALVLLVIGYAVSDGGHDSDRKRIAEGDASKMNTENLSALFENGAYTLVVQKNGVTVHKDFGRGVGPALRVFDAQPELLKGALVCDTIVGKAAAAIYLLGGAAGVYAETMSVAAADFLTANGVDCACETKTEKLLNRQGTGLCPFEQAVLELERPEDCLPVIRATLARLMAGKNNK